MRAQSRGLARFLQLEFFDHPRVVTLMTGQTT